MAYGARLESVLGASPRGFESPILRHQSGTVRFRIFLCLIYSRFSQPSPLPDFCPLPAPTYAPHSLPRAPPAPGPLSPGPGFTPGPAFSRRRRPTHSLPLPITQRPATSETKNPATHCMTGIDGGSAGIRTRGGLHHTAFRVLHLRPLGHATSAAQSTGDYSQYANLTYPAALT